MNTHTPVHTSSSELFVFLCRGCSRPSIIWSSVMCKFEMETLLLALIESSGTGGSSGPSSLVMDGSYRQQSPTSESTLQQASSTPGAVYALRWNPPMRMSMNDNHAPTPGVTAYPTKIVAAIIVRYRSLCGVVVRDATFARHTLLHPAPNPMTNLLANSTHLLFSAL
jgi:hypothetical protein